MSGLVALGDSITNGHGEPALGVHPQSWAQWLAEALDVPFLKLASDGATTADVLAEQVPRLRAAAAAAAAPAGSAPAAAPALSAPTPSAAAAGRFSLACVHVGVNDTRGIDWDAAAYERDLRAIAAAAAEHADRVLLCTLPLDLGRPRAAPKPAQAGAIIRVVAADTGGGAAVVVDLDDLAGPPLLLPDAVHPTALGQLEIATRAAAALRTAGVAVPRDPRDLAEIHDSRRAAARNRARLAILLARDLRRRAVERVLGIR